MAIMFVMFFGLVFYSCSNGTTTTIPTDAITSSSTTETTTSATISTTTTTKVTTTTQVFPTGNFVTLADFTNFSTEFVKDEPITEISFYYFEEKYGIPYVNIEEFINVLLGIIDDSIQVEVNDNVVKVYVLYYYTEDEKAEYGITEDSFEAYVTFDFDTTIVSAPNIDALDYFSGETTTDFSEGLTVVSSTSEDEPEFTIDLGSYGFCFYTVTDGEDTIYTIPVSIANLFLSGSMYDVVANGYHLYGIDSYQLGDTEDYSAAVVQNDLITDEMITESKAFLAMAFDNFYGLKDYKGIESFTTYMGDYFGSSKSFEYKLSSFVDSLCDLHTGIIEYGQNNPYYDYYDIVDYPTYIYDYFYDYYGTPASLSAATISWESYEDMAYINITEFSTDFKEKLDTVMAEVAEFDPEYVVIDLSANGGGVIAGVLQLLNYMTNENISLYTTTMGADSSSTYSVEGDKALDAEFFLVTSAATYSAANLTVAIAKEMGIARTIGSQSGGGACAVKVLVLPNGAMMQISSNMNLTFSDYTTVEEGIATDYNYSFRSAGMSYINYGRVPTHPDAADYYAIIQEMDNPS